MFRCTAALLLAFVITQVVAAQGTESPELVESRQLNARVIELYGQARYQEAIPLAVRAIELREKVLGTTHEDLIPLLTNLGQLYRLANRLPQAQSALERALSIADAHFPNDVRAAHLLDKLAAIAYEQHHPNDAEKFFLKAIQIKEKAVGSENLDIAQTMFALAELYRFRNDFAKAEPLYERSIAIREKSAGKDKTDLVRALTAYLTTLIALNKTTQAGEVQKRLSDVMATEGVLESGVLNGRAVKLVQPGYPRLARNDHASGTVRVQVVIDEKGKVISAKAINSGPIHLALVAAAEEAARSSIFTPTLLSGVPVKVSGIIIYNFIAQ